MSAKLVRRLLQQTSDVNSLSVAASGKKQNKRRKKKKTDDLPQVGAEEIIKQQVNNILFLDLAMENRGKNKNDAAQRIHSKQQRERKTQKKGTGIVLGNSRGSSSHLRKAPVPTFNKKRYKKETEEKRLLEIAKLLNKNSKKSRQTVRK